MIACQYCNFLVFYATQQVVVYLLAIIVWVYLYWDHEGLGFLARKYHPKTSLIFTL